MKTYVIALLSLLCISISSCTDCDDDSGSTAQQIMNITYEVTTTRNTEAIINRTLDNNTIMDRVSSLPYNYTYTQQPVTSGTYSKISFQDDGSYAVTSSGSSWTDYTATLVIRADNNIVKTQDFQITENTGTVLIEHTFQ